MLIRMAKIQNIDTSNASKVVEQQSLIACGNANDSTATLEDTLVISKKAKYSLTIGSNHSAHKSL